MWRKERGGVEDWGRKEKELSDKIEFNLYENTEKFYDCFEREAKTYF